jgi:hypothetical protein
VSGVHGTALAGWAGIAVVVAVAIGLALAAMGSARAARRLERSGREEWQ